MKRLWYVATLFSLVLTGCGAKATPIATVAPLPTLSPIDRQTRVLEALYGDIHDQYIYTDFGGVDWDALHSQYQDKIKGGLSNADFEKAMAEMVAGFPNGSVVYETRQTRIDQELQNTALYSGIGAYISVRTEPEPHVVIMAVVQGSPAEQAGLKAHDSIFSIDGQAVTAEEGLDVVQRVRGEAGTEVSLEVASPGAPHRTVKVTRGKLTAVDTLEGGVLNSTSIGYLRFPVSPDTTLAQEIAGWMQSLEAKGSLTGMILDLRVSRSSGNWPLSEMLTLFDTGDLGEFYTRTDTTPVNVSGLDVGGSQKMPLVVLVGPDTEGQAEIFAAALQASKRAQVIGLPTAGKIFGYSALPLPDGSRLTVAVSSYKTQGGTDLGESGVKPDVVLENDWDQVDPTNDPVIVKAVELLTSK